MLGGMSLNGLERNNLFRNVDGKRFAEMGWIEDADRIEDGRAVAAIDIENDGDLDLIIGNYMQPARLLVNRGTPGNHWIELLLAGAGPAQGGSNRSAIGARAVVTAGGRQLSREVISSWGYLTGTSRVLHFGLGAAEKIDLLSIRWPSGRVQEIRDLAVDRKHRIEEPPGDPRPTALAK